MRKDGFTLVELLVAMSVFIIAATIAVGGFVRALRTQRTVNHLLSVNSNASLTIEQMARELRSGHSFVLRSATPALCPAGQSDEVEFIRFKEGGDKRMFYKLAGGAIVKRECPATEAAGDCSARSFLPLTASNVKVDRLCFVNTASSASDPWRITVLMAIGSSDPRLEWGTFNFQTTVSARILPQEL